MNHLGRVVGRSAGWNGHRRDQSRKSHAAEVDAWRLRFEQLLVVPCVVPPEVLAIQLVAAVHRNRLVPVVLANCPGFTPCHEVRQAIGGDGGWVDEDDRAAVRFGLSSCEFEQVQRPFDVYMMRGHRREFRARRQKRRQVKNQVNFEFRQNPLEHVRVENRSGELPVHVSGDVRIKSVDIEGNDCLVPLLAPDSRRARARSLRSPL